MLQWMVYVVIVSVVLSAAALSAERALRLQRKMTRWVWAGAVVASLVIPTVIASVSIEIPNITAPAVSGKIIVLRDVTSLPLKALSQVHALPSSSSARASLDARLKRYWLIASGLLVLFLASSAVQLAVRKRGWTRTTVAGAPVYIAPAVGPAVVGLLRPRIVLPQWVAQSPEWCQSHIIAHEQSHLDAGDPLLLTSALCLLVFMPWNLPLWWQLHRLRRAIEVDCDARVLRAGHDANRYGETLIEVGQRQSAFVGAIAAMSESKSFLEQRIQIMMRKPGGWWKLSAAALGLTSMCLVALAAQVSPPNSGDDQLPQLTAVDPSLYDGYVGHYQFGPNAVMTVTRDKDHLFIRLTGQGPVEIFPSSKTEYFAKVVKASITFDTDAQGHATSLTLHQNGMNQAARRMDDAAAQQIEDALQTRIQSQTPNPGSEAAVRRLFGSLLAGKPIYDEMSPGLQEATHKQLPQLLAAAQHFGAIQSMEFRGIGNQGWDIYDVHHEHAVVTWRVMLAEDGKIQGALFQAGP
jgi:bla regulator protein blaR1